MPIGPGGAPALGRERPLIVADEEDPRPEPEVGAEEEAAEEPLMAPELAVEILSPGDRRIDIDHKIGIYLACGAALVLVVDPRQRTIEAHDSRVQRIFVCGEEFNHIAVPGFAIALTELFSRKN